MKKFLIIIFNFLFIFIFAQNSFANEENNDIYQNKVHKAIEKKYNLNNLSDNEIIVFENLIKISNKENYKHIIKILKNESIENLDKISNIEINYNLMKKRAGSKVYETAYIILRKGLFTKFPNEKLIPTTIKMMYDCENEIEMYKLAVYGAAFLYHKENITISKNFWTVPIRVTIKKD